MHVDFSLLKDTVFIYNDIYDLLLRHFAQVENNARNKVKRKGKKEKKHRNAEFCKAFGEHLKKLRLQKGFGLRQFATLADLEYGQIYKIENGANPTIATVAVLAETLGVAIQNLFDFKYSLTKAN